MKDSKTNIDVSSEYTPINIAVRRENFDIESDEKFAIPGDSGTFTPQAVRSQRSAESTVPAFMNLDSVSCKKKTNAWVRVDQRVIPSTVKTVPCDRSFTSTGRPVRSDESVASVERSVFRTQVDQDQSSVERSNLREFLERNAEVAIHGENEARRRLSDAEAHLESRQWERRKSERVTGLIKLKEKGLMCAESWK